jgi:hypothetical protein
MDEKTEKNEEVELTQEQQQEQEALLAVNGDIKGEVKPNYSPDEGEEVVEPVEEVEEGGEQEDAEDAPEITPEADEAGVYAPPTVEDPGDFKPKDYSFTVQTTDGKAHKITSVEEAEALASRLDTNPELISASQFLTLGRKTAFMEQGIAADRQVYDKAKEEHDAQDAQTQTREQYLTQWQAETNYLRSKGGLPPITDELNNSDWTDPKIASQTGVKETLAVFKWMEEENNRRIAAGLPPDLSVVSAHNAMQAEMKETAERDEDNAERSVNRSRGAMVGRKAAFIPDNKPAGKLVGAARGLDDLMTDAYYAAQ